MRNRLQAKFVVAWKPNFSVGVFSVIILPLVPSAWSGHSGHSGPRPTTRPSAKFILFDQLPLSLSLSLSRSKRNAITFIVR